MTAPTGRMARLRGALTTRQWASVAGMVGVVALLHLSGWGVLLGFVVPQHLPMGAAGTFGVGLGVTAYTLGMRHAFDADHIAAIDNTTRKLMHQGSTPLTVGFWFSLGHSTIVFGLCAVLATGVRALTAQMTAESTAVHDIMAVVGTAVSGIFLCLIGIVNLVILVGIVAVFRRMRRGEFDEAALEARLSNRGFASRFVERLNRVIAKPWQMYLVGLLFGLGFDTATEVGLLVLAGGAAITLPWYAILTLPILFAAGMSLLDSLDGFLMSFAYGWAFTKPVRKVYYNLVITALSVAVALVVGAVELASVLAQRLGAASGPLALVGAIDLNQVGYAIAAIFLVAWILAAAAWKFGRIEEKWSVSPGPAEDEGAQG